MSLDRSLLANNSKTPHALYKMRLNSAILVIWSKDLTRKLLKIWGLVLTFRPIGPKAKFRMITQTDCRSLKAWLKSWILSLYRKIHKFRDMNSGRLVTSISRRMKCSRMQYQNTELKHHLLKTKSTRRWWTPLIKLSRLYKTCWMLKTKQSGQKKTKLSKWDNRWHNNVSWMRPQSNNCGTSYLSQVTQL